jgi:hypothetical protein
MTKLLPAPPRAEGYVNIPPGLLYDMAITPFNYCLWGHLSYKRHDDDFVLLDMAEIRESLQYKGQQPSEKRITAGIRRLVEEGWLVPAVHVEGGQRMYRVTGGTEEKRDATLADFDKYAEMQGEIERRPIPRRGRRGQRAPKACA